MLNKKMYLGITVPIVIFILGGIFLLDNLRSTIHSDIYWFLNSLAVFTTILFTPFSILHAINEKKKVSVLAGISIFIFALYLAFDWASKFIWHSSSLFIGF